jgi:5-methylcytosine-specific restriction endonuclease McrA
MAGKRRKTKKRWKKGRSKKVVKIDKFKRYQTSLRVHHLYPAKKDGICDCGCGKELTGKQRRWASTKCTTKVVKEFKIIKGDVQVIREELRRRDKEICAECNEPADVWQADHILEVRHGGGGCTLDNFQTLCTDCHKKKTKENYKTL